MTAMITEVYQAFKKANVDEQHALAAAKAVADTKFPLEKETLATKEDLLRLESKLDKRIDSLEVRIDKRIDSLEVRIDQVEEKIDHSADKMINKIWWIIVSTMGIVIASLSLIFFIITNSTQTASQQPVIQNPFENPATQQMLRKIIKEEISAGQPVKEPSTDNNLKQ